MILENLHSFLKKLNNNWKACGIYFFWILFFTYLLKYSVEYLFLTEGLYFQTFSEQFPLLKIEKTIEVINKWQWLSYILLPILVLIRVIFTSLLLYTGLFFNESQICFRKIFGISLFTEFIFVFAGLVKFIILIFFKEVSILDDLQFQPLSLLEFLNKNKVDSMFVYPLSLLNVFELLYFLTLAWLLKNAINEDAELEPVSYGKSLGIVTVSYGSGLLLWVAMVMFITLNLT